jgi:hypothetical protein
VVSVRQTINSQRGAANTVRELQPQFANKDYAERRRQLNDILDSDYREGRITKDIWEKIRGPEVD